MKNEEWGSWLSSLDITLRWLAVSFLLFAVLTLLAKAAFSDVREFTLTGLPMIIEVEKPASNTD